MNALLRATRREWPRVQIVDFARTSAGGTPKKSGKEFYVGGDIPWLLSGEVGARDILGASHFITASGLANSSAKLFPAGSVLVAMYGATAGEVGILRFESATNQAVCAILPSTRHIPEYLYYYLLFAKPNLVAQAVGNAQPNISQAKIKATAVPLPPLEEQKRIVAVLDQAFAALDRARALAEANLADAQELFDNTLLAVFDELLPAAAMMTLGDAALGFSRGKSRHRPRNDPSLYDGDYPFIQTGDIRRSEGSIREYTQTYNDVGLAQSKLWPVGTVCITIAANIAETGVLEFEACFPDSVIGMVPDPVIANAYYVEYMLRYFAKELKLQGKGSAQDNINLATFENAKFPIPTLEQQVRVVDKLDAMTEAVGSLRTRYQQKLADLANLRQSLLQKAFSGELT